MTTKHNIVVVGAGGIGEAVALILLEKSAVAPNIFIGDINLDQAKNVAANLQSWTTREIYAHPFHMPKEGMTQEMEDILNKGHIILDCLPGALAPKMAGYSKKYDLHYANLTEYVNETDQIIALAKDAKQGFVLQTGLAPGFINILAHQLFQKFCKDHGVEEVEHISMKVGALTEYAVSPHFYGFTWSPVGVATEYLKDAIAVRGGKKVTLKSLAERDHILIDGVLYESDLTSGGAADLPDALAGKVKSLDYKTIRYKGHYGWVKKQLKKLKKKNRIARLQEVMENNIPRVENDLVLVYASVQGRDSNGILRKIEKAYSIRPVMVGNKMLRAIQTTTAAPLAQVAELLLEKKDLKGVITQSMLDTDEFMKGTFVKAFYG